MGAPDIEVSSENERREYIKNTFKGGQLHRTKTLAQGMNVAISTLQD